MYLHNATQTQLLLTIYIKIYTKTKYIAKFCDVHFIFQKWISICENITPIDVEAIKKKLIGSGNNPFRHEFSLANPADEKASPHLNANGQIANLRWEGNKKWGRNKNGKLKTVFRFNDWQGGIPSLFFSKTKCSKTEIESNTNSPTKTESGKFTKALSAKAHK
jgi:hypothetical protein